jgi:hypothetical protein
MIKNIYETNILKGQMNNTQQLVNQRASLAQDPLNTNIIPSNFNMFQGQKSTILMDMGDKLTDDNFVSTFDFSTKVNKYENKKNEFLGAFELQKLNNNMPVSKNAFQKTPTAYSLERGLELIEGFSPVTNDMTYGIVDSNNFTHTNMQPFTKSKGIEHNNYNAENRNYLVNLYTGSSQNYVPKKETPRFFLPEKDITFGATMGMPNQSDFLQSRFIPSNRRQGEKPFEPVKVTPGLGLNYYDEATFGFHDPYRAMPKTVDELRVENKPKITYGGVIIPGKKGEYRGQQAPVAKNRTEKFKEYNPYDMVPVGGEYRGPTARDKFVLNENNRMVNKEIVGGAHHSSVNWQYVFDKDTVKSNRQTLSAEPTTAARGQYHYNPEYPMPSTFEVFEQERETTNKYNVGPVGSDLKTVPAIDYKDIAKMTIKETTSNNNQMNGVTRVYGKPISNFQDQAKMTIKETTSNNNQMNGVTRVYGKPISNFQDSAKTTIRETMEDTQQMNGVTQVYGKPTTHLQDPVKTTIKQTTVKNQYLNGVTQVYGKPTTQLQDSAKSTIRETMEDTQQTNGVTQIYGKPTTQLQDQAKTTIKQTTILNNQTNGVTQVYVKPTTQLQDEAKVTIKQTTEDNKYLSGITPIHPAPKSNLQDEAKTTIKQTTINKNYISGANQQNGDGYLANHYDAKTTIKETTTDYYHVGPSGSSELEAPTVQMAERNMEIDGRRQNLNLRKPPTNVGNFNGPEKSTVNLTTFNNPILYEHFNHPHQEQSGSLGIATTKHKQDLLNINTERINPYVVSSVINNPLVNNVLIQKDYKEC